MDLDEVNHAVYLNFSCLIPKYKSTNTDSVNHSFWDVNNCSFILVKEIICLPIILVWVPNMIR